MEVESRRKETHLQAAPRWAFRPALYTGRAACFWETPEMEEAETRLADARQREAKAREEFEAALAAVKANPPPATGWEDRQRRASAAAVAFGIAGGDLAAAEINAGLREPPPDPFETDAGKLIVALVRVPTRAADALRYGSGDFAAWIAEAVGFQYRADFDPLPDDPPSLREWAETVQSRFAAAPEDADAFRCERVGVVEPDGGTAAAIAAALDRAGEG